MKVLVTVSSKHGATEGIGKQLNPDNNLFESVAAYLMPILAAKGAMPQISVSGG